MTVKLPGIPKRPGPVMFYQHSADAGWGKWWAMMQAAQAAEAQGMKVLYVSLDPKRYSTS